MKKSLASAIALSALIATSSFAADLPSRKEPIVTPPPPPMWAGFYAGLNIGYGFGQSSSVSTSGIPVDPWAQNARRTFGRFTETSRALAAANGDVIGVNQNGVIGGGQIGYNYEVYQRVIVGVETDIQGSGISGSGNKYGSEVDTLNYGGIQPLVDRTTYGGGAVNAGINWFGTLRGRIGYLVTPDLMLFGTGGFTYGEVYGRVDPSAVSVFTIAQSSANNRGRYEGTQIGVPSNGNKTALNTGWNAGGGFEWMFSPNWSTKIEAFYYNLGQQSVSSALATSQITPRVLAVANFTGWQLYSSNVINYNGIILRAGLNYHFDLSRSLPVVAKF